MIYFNSDLFKIETKKTLLKCFIFTTFLVVLFVFYTQSNLKFTNFDLAQKTRKYLIYRCDSDCGGWADRLKGIFSAYYWSLITDRQLIIEINQPCIFTYLFKPNKFNWNVKIKKSKDYSEIILAKMQDNKFKYELKDIDLHTFYSNYTTIVLKANRNYAWSFSKNKFVQAKLKSLGFLNTTLIDMQYSFHSVYNKLFKFSNKLNRVYKRFIKRAKPNKNSKLFCVHIRTGDINSKGESVNQHMRFVKVENAKSFWLFVRKRFISTLKLTDKYKIFISSNSAEVIKSGVKEFGVNKVVYYDLSGSLTYHIDFMQSSQICSSAAEKTMLDFHTFQACDGILLTRNSQYGVFASLNRPSLPKLFYIQSDKLDKITFSPV